MHGEVLSQLRAVGRHYSDLGVTPAFRFAISDFRQIPIDWELGPARGARSRIACQHID